ncbi:MAG: glycosyltransferase family 4 protein [Candidatus Aenigmarchaeota archaeon]|nr:glycosyltransferase family 4 protein [Candidatus Aenigmarchaeota archaeon]
MIPETTRILMIGWGWPPNIEGGLDTHIYNLTGTLSTNKDIHIDLFLPKSKIPENITPKDNLKIRPIDTQIETDTIDDIIASVDTYNQKITTTRFRPDIIHIHDWLGIDAGITLKKRFDIPLILTIHSLEYMRTATDNPTSQGKISDIEKKGIEASDQIITVSRLMKEEIIKEYDIPNEKITVIPNGPTFKKYTEDTEREKDLIVYCGRLAGQKGIEYLLLAAKEVLKTRPDAKFIIIGKGYMEKQLKDLAKLLGIDSSIEFTGFISLNKIEEYYHRAEIVVAPSIYEPFGISVLDALTTATPAITTYDAGIAEDLKDRIDILKIERRNSGSLKKAILSILENKGLRTTLSENGRKASDNYSWTKIAKDTKDIYLNLL